MSKPAKPAPPSGGYEVGYGKPPLHTRFRKGQSGNARGRPRNGAMERARKIVLEEAYRTVTVREGEKIVEMPAIRAVMRSHLRDALKGNGPTSGPCSASSKNWKPGRRRLSRPQMRARRPRNQ